MFAGAVREPAQEQTVGHAGEPDQVTGAGAGAVGHRRADHKALLSLDSLYIGYVEYEYGYAAYDPAD